MPSQQCRAFAVGVIAPFRASPDGWNASSAGLLAYLKKSAPETGHRYVNGLAGAEVWCECLLRVVTGRSGSGTRMAGQGRNWSCCQIVRGAPDREGNKQMAARHRYRYLHSE